MHHMVHLHCYSSRYKLFSFIIIIIKAVVFKLENRETKTVIGIRAIIEGRDET